MKASKWVKKIWPYLLIFVWIFLSNIFDDISGKHALFNKAFMTFPYMISGIIAFIALVLSVKRILSKKLHINLIDIIFNLFLALVAVIFIALNVKTTIAICYDVIVGKKFTTLEISNDSKFLTIRRLIIMGFLIRNTF